MNYATSNDNNFSQKGMSHCDMCDVEFVYMLKERYKIDTMPTDSTRASSLIDSILYSFTFAPEP